MTTAISINGGMPASTTTFVIQPTSNQFAIPAGIERKTDTVTFTAYSGDAGHTLQNNSLHQHYYRPCPNSALSDQQLQVNSANDNSSIELSSNTTSTAAQQQPMSCRGCRQPIWDKFLVKVGGGSNSLHLVGGTAGRHFHHRTALYMASSSSLTTPSFPPIGFSNNSFLSPSLQQQKAFEKGMRWPAPMLPPPFGGHGKKSRAHRKLFLESGSSRMSASTTNRSRAEYDDTEFDYVDDDDDDDDDDGDEDDNLLTPATPVWHEECMKCVVCRDKLEHICYLHDSKIYCREDYLRLFGIKCSVCNRIINRQELVMRVLGNIYHIQCFVCSICGQPLRKGDHFTIRSGQLICKADLEREANLLALAAQGVTPASLAAAEISGTMNDNVAFSAFNDASERAEGREGEIQPSKPEGTPSSVSGFQQRHHLMTSCSQLDGRSSTTTFLGLTTTANGGALGSSTHSLLNCLGSMGNMALAAQRRGPKRPRTILTSQQRRAFKKSFETSAKPCRKVREQLAKELGLSVRVVQVWFQNQRAKIKKIQRKQQLQQNSNANAKGAGGKNRQAKLLNKKQQSGRLSNKSGPDSTNSSINKNGNGKNSKRLTSPYRTRSALHARSEASTSPPKKVKVAELGSRSSTASTSTCSSSPASSSSPTSSPASSTAAAETSITAKELRFAIPVPPSVVNYSFNDHHSLNGSQFYSAHPANNLTDRSLADLSSSQEQQNVSLFFAPNHPQNFVFTATSSESNMMLSSQLPHIQQQNEFSALADAANSIVLADDPRRPYGDATFIHESSNFVNQHHVLAQHQMQIPSSNAATSSAASTLPMVQLNNMCNNNISAPYF